MSTAIAPPGARPGPGRLRRTRRRLKDQLGEPRQTTTFPGYADVVEIGSGAFAAVYRATELETSRPVALKLLRLSGLTSHVTEAFAREVKALGALGGHPNIVSLYRTLTTPDGRPVLVLELCQCSMAERVRRQGPLPVGEAVAVGVKIAGALETAHRVGLLQRDIKPQNILITQYGEPALADFGVAALQASAQATEGVFGFTTLYAPPEVLEGRPLSPATDVYGLASTIYQLIAGRAPFAAFDGEAPASVILRILRDSPPPLRRQDVPIELSDLLQQALAKSPDDRPPSAVALAEALRGVERSCGWPATSYAVYGEPIGSRPVDASSRGATGTASAPMVGPGTPAERPPWPPAAAAVPLAPQAPLAGAPLAPLAPLAPSGSPPAGPGIVAPAAARRNVVRPEAPPAPGQPREVEDGPPFRSATERPIFVNPPAVPWQHAPLGQVDAAPEPVRLPSDTWTTPPASPDPGRQNYDHTLSYGGLTAALKANFESTPPSPTIEEPGNRRRLAITGVVVVVIIVLAIALAMMTGVL